MAGKISYIQGGVPKTGANYKTGEQSSSYSNAFTVKESSGSLVSEKELTPKDKNFYVMKAGSRSKAKKGYKPIIDTDTGKSFYTGSVQPFANMTINECVDKLNLSLNIMDKYTSTRSIFDNLASSMYNRFKLPNYNEMLRNGFPHLFFVRPSCNIIGTDGNLVADNKHHSLFQYAKLHSPNILKELSGKNANKSHDFMLSLSNAASSFNSNDEGIETGTYGSTYTGYNIIYGKNDIKSKTSGSFSVDLKDDRNFTIYQIIRCWVEYISGVYRGELAPKTSDVLEKTLDYPGALYYIITAEDGETILFWSKYYGVFPTNIPTTQYSWAKNTTVSNPELTVDFAYSFKKDFVPETIMEFNTNAGVGVEAVSDYEPVFDEEIGVGAKTWVGTPFIEFVDDGVNEPCYKLRFTS